MKRFLIISLIPIITFASGVSAAQVKKDASSTPGVSSATTTVVVPAPAGAPVVAPSDPVAIEKKCMEVPSEKRLEYAMEYYEYIDYRLQDILDGVAYCKAFTTGEKAECDVFKKNVTFAGMQDPDMNAGACADSTGVFSMARKAAESGKACYAEVNSYCEENNLCGPMSDWGEIKCQCTILSSLLCEMIEAETPGQCSRIKKNEVLKKNLPTWYFPAMISECQSVIKGQPSKLIGKGEKKLISIVFLASLFRGNKWALFEDATDQAALNVQEPFIRYWKYIHYTKLPCVNKLNSAWDDFCMDLPQIHEMKRNTKEAFEKAYSTDGGTDKSGQ